MRFYFWNVVLSVVFAAIALAGFGWLFVRGTDFRSVPTRDLVLITLAILRLVRLFTYDHITAFVRNWFKDAQEGSLAHTLGVLINCPWCNSLWFTFVVVFAYFATPYAWPFILVLALSAVASAFQITTNLIGWHAEGKKQEVKRTSGA